MDKPGHVFNDNNRDRKYDAAYIRHLLCKYFTNGITNGSFDTSARGKMIVDVSSGTCHILGAVKETVSVTSMEIPTASTTKDRVDAIIIEYMANDVRDINIKLVSDIGDDFSPIRDTSVFQLVVSKINVRKSATEITNDDIDDTRADTDICGYIDGKFNGFNFMQMISQMTCYIDETEGEAALYVPSINANMSIGDETYATLHESVINLNGSMESCRDGVENKFSRVTSIMESVDSFVRYSGLAYTWASPSSGRFNIPDETVDNAHSLICLVSFGKVGDYGGHRYWDNGLSCMYVGRRSRSHDTDSGLAFDCVLSMSYLIRNANVNTNNIISSRYKRRFVLTRESDGYYVYMYKSDTEKEKLFYGTAFSFDFKVYGVGIENNGKVGYRLSSSSSWAHVSGLQIYT